MRLMNGFYLVLVLTALPATAAGVAYSCPASNFDCISQLKQAVDQNRDPITLSLISCGGQNSASAQAACYATRIKDVLKSAVDPSAKKLHSLQ